MAVILLVIYQMKALNPLYIFYVRPPTHLVKTGHICAILTGYFTYQPLVNPLVPVPTLAKTVQSLHGK